MSTSLDVMPWLRCNLRSREGREQIIPAVANLREAALTAFTVISLGYKPTPALEEQLRKALAPFGVES